MLVETGQASLIPPVGAKRADDSHVTCFPPAALLREAWGGYLPPDQSLLRNCEHLSIWNRMVSHLSNDEKRARETRTLQPEE